MAQPAMLEATVLQRETERAAEIGFVPSEALTLAGLGPPSEAVEALGLVRGVPIATADELVDVFYASLAGRVVPFDTGSFGRWRPQRLGQPGSANAVFAEQIVTNDLVPISSSPIRGTSLKALLAQGAGWTAGVTDTALGHPLRGLAVVIVTEGGLTVAQMINAWRGTAVIAVKWRLRQRWGIPPDWLPPEDR